MTTDKRAAAIAALQKAREALSRVCREQGGMDPFDYEPLWFLLDCEEWTLEIVVHSRHGGTSRYGHEAMAERWAKRLCGGAA